MKDYLYEVILEGYSTKVRAFDSTAAIILAKAEAIKHCLAHELVSVTRLE